MKIIYKDNPLTTVIELSESEQSDFWLKLKIQELEYLLESAWFEANKSDFDIKVIRKDLDIDYWCPEVNPPSKLDNRIDEIFAYSIAYLKGSHVGNCTAVPCSCSKCHAEELLGINTIQGLSKYEASMINREFSKFSTIDEVIESLENYIPDKTRGGWHTVSDERFNEVSITFKAQAKSAASWLKRYKLEKLS